jgi:adenosylcobinamide kinase / adenosylcobinamide-phosphate guanylyltransferase
MTLVLLLGGARSGKSRLAVSLAREQTRPVAFLATAQPRDAEMAERIERHRAERPSGWETIEEPLGLGETIRRVDSGSCLVIDCLSLWLSNRLETEAVSDAATRAERAAAAAAARPGLTLAVSNEVGLGLVPMHPLGRTYRDALGNVNTAWAKRADRVLLVVAGHALRLERSPRLAELLDV